MHYLDALDENWISLEEHRAQIREARERELVEFSAPLRLWNAHSSRGGNVTWTGEIPDLSLDHQKAIT